MIKAPNDEKIVQMEFAMYRFQMSQFIIPDDFFLPFEGKLSNQNKWVQLAQLIPWNQLEEKYAAHFSKQKHGQIAYSVRMALGALIIAQMRDLSDRELVEEIPENIYYQYFLGLPGYQEKVPFDSSLMVHFRKRFPQEVMNEINELITKRSDKHNDKDEDQNKPTSGQTEFPTDDSTQENSGDLILDATCVPADIHYPTDIHLLNHAREALEGILDTLHEPDVGMRAKPRDMREIARIRYLDYSKKKKHGKKQTMKTIKQQLQFVRRDLAFVEVYANVGRLQLLNKSQYRNLLVANEIFRQQALMYRNKENSVEDRIVSLSQPHIRPIVRGKAGAHTEFGAKLEISVVDGFVYSERLDFNSFHEGTGLEQSLERYRERFGYYPASVIADKIYRNRSNYQLCKSLNIRISGPRLGRPPKDENEYRGQKHLERLDAKIRNIVEGRFGTAKRKHGLNRVYAKQPETTATVITLNLLVLNLEHMLRILYSLFSRFSHFDSFVTIFVPI